ncbi:MAG: hypothetical protein CMD78_01765 [Gammaproteobacteria bacterium]|nr:hypothetical protein [Gammaproteobacteria bacterium]
MSKNKFINIFSFYCCLFAFFSATNLHAYEVRLIAAPENCLDSYNKIHNTNYKLGVNETEGLPFYLSMGQAGILDEIQSNNYHESVQNAVMLASLAAKRSLAESRVVQIKQDLIDEYEQERDSGVKPELKKEGEMTVWDKAKWVIRNKLEDSLDLDQLDKEVAKRSQEMGRILSQKYIEQAITTKAYEEIIGMSNVFIQTSPTDVCVLSTKSEETEALAIALGSGEFDSIKDETKIGKTLQEIIPDTKKEGALLELIGSFGLIVHRDQKGQLVLVSYAQAGALNETPTELIVASKKSETRARAQIAAFQEEVISVNDEMKFLEVKTTYEDTLKAKLFSENSMSSRIKASTSSRLTGIDIYSTWYAEHPISNQPVAGTVLVWTPETTEFKF